MSEVLDMREDVLCHSVSLGGGALNMVTEYSEMGEGRGCLVAYTTPCFPNFSHFPPLPTTLQLWKDVWHIFEVDLGSALLCGRLFFFLISFPDPKSQLTSKGLRSAQWEELGWGDQITIVFLKGIYLEFLLKETSIIFKQSFSCFPGQIWIHYCNAHYVDNFFLCCFSSMKSWLWEELSPPALQTQARSCQLFFKDPAMGQVGRMAL